VRRRGKTWLVFGLAAVALVIALGWISLETLRLEEAQVQALEEAGLQESLRVGLWRLDAKLMPLLATESSRPYFHYREAYAPGEAMTSALDRIEPGKVLIASPLRKLQHPFLQLHLEFRNGAVTSPQVLADGRGDPALRERLERLKGGILGRALGAPLPEPATPFLLTSVNGNNFQGAGNRQVPAIQQAWSENEFNARNKFAIQAQTLSLEIDEQPRVPLEGVQGAMTPIWVDAGEGDPQLFYLRDVQAGGEVFRQGIWVDWEAASAALLEEISDIFPAARLTPLVAASQIERPNDERERRLASVPAILQPGLVAASEPLGLTATRVVLLLSWAAIVGTLVAVGLVLRAALDLGERRGRFVSAVTHELRTPLTTFSMYTQMLADGMVEDEAARHQYLETLRSESARLTRVVESVLLYSRLEDGRRAARRETVSVEDLVDRVLSPLSRRAADGSMELAVESDVAPGACVNVDPQGVEQILLNLVDNACKYASEADDRRLHISASTTDNQLHIRFSDHGPGVPADVRREIFRPYRRAERHAAGAVSGLGLGLALAQGLARAFEGDLVLLPTEEGAAFRLTLPLA